MVPSDVASKAKVGIMAWTQFACPPIWDLDYEVVMHLLSQPFPSKEELLTRAPPSFKKLEAETDLLLFNDFIERGPLRLTRPSLLRNSGEPSGGPSLMNCGTDIPGSASTPVQQLLCVANRNVCGESERDSQC